MMRGRTAHQEGVPGLVAKGYRTLRPKRHGGVFQERVESIRDAHTGERGVVRL